MATTTLEGTRASRSPLIIIFFTVFIDLVGFGIIIPLGPYLARELSASAIEIGLLMSIYSVMQFLFSPFWGSLSDRIGRRPTLLITLFGIAASYILFAFAKTYWVLFLARSLAGVFGGNISTAHAYIADVTKPEERSKGMGMIGAAFGLGFIFGPLLGGLLGSIGQSLGSEPPFGLSFSALGAAVICFANFAFALTSLKESLPPEKRGNVKARPKRIREILNQLKRPLVGPLIFVYFLSGLAMAQMEAMLFPFVADEHGWDLRTASYGFAYVGVLMVLTQGYFIRKWMPKYGEPLILSVGLALFSVSLFGIAAGATSITILAITMTILAFGNGMMRPPNLGIISLLSPAEEQGVAMGVTNSIAALGRIFGPVIGGVLYERVSRGSPFVLAGLLAGAAWLIILMIYRRLPATGRKATAQ